LKGNIPISHTEGTRSYDNVGKMKKERGLLVNEYNFYTDGEKFMVHTGRWFEQDMEDGIIAYEISELQPHRRELTAFDHGSFIISLINYTKGERDAHLDIYVSDLKFIKAEMVRKLMDPKEFVIYHGICVIRVPEINYISSGQEVAERMLDEYKTITNGL
jgi:hypothetical protein